MTEWRCRNVVDIWDAEVPRIVDSSLRDNGLNARIIDPNTRFMLTNTSDSGVSGKACARIWVYRESTPLRPSYAVSLGWERMSLRRSVGWW